MLRLNSRSRNRNMKNKHSKKVIKSTPEKSKYQEDYNEIILNDLVPEEHKEEFGLDNESNQKKQGGPKLNFALGGKKRPNKKQHHNKNQNKEVNNSDITENAQISKEELPEDVAETSKVKKSQKSKKRPNHKKKSNDNQKVQDNKNLKNNKIKSKNEHKSKAQYGHNKSKQNDEHEGKSGYGKKSHQQSELGTNKKNLKKSENNDKESTNTSYEKTKSSNQKIINPKKRKRPNIHKEEIEDEVRSLEEVEPEIEIEAKDDNSEDIISFRGDENTEENNMEKSQQKVSEIKEVKSKFENIVWSEDKFPKK